MLPGGDRDPIPRSEEDETPTCAGKAAAIAPGGAPKATAPTNVELQEKLTDLAASVQIIAKATALTGAASSSAAGGALALAKASGLSGMPMHLSAVQNASPGITIPRNDVEMLKTLVVNVRKQLQDAQASKLK